MERCWRCPSWGARITEELVKVTDVVPYLGTQLCFPSKAVLRTCFEVYNNSESVL